ASPCSACHPLIPLPRSLLTILPPPISTLFPYTTLFRSPSLRKTRNTSQAEPRAPGGATTESLILGFLPGGSRDTSGSDLPSRPREASGLHRGTKHQLERIRWDVDLKLDPPLTCG